MAESDSGKKTSAKVSTEETFARFARCVRFENASLICPQVELKLVLLGPRSNSLLPSLLYDLTFFLSAIPPCLHFFSL